MSKKNKIKKSNTKLINQDNSSITYTPYGSANIQFIFKRVPRQPFRPPWMSYNTIWIVMRIKLIFTKRWAQMLRRTITTVNRIQLQIPKWSFGYKTGYSSWNPYITDFGFAFGLQEHGRYCVLILLFSAALTWEKYGWAWNRKLD